MVTPIQADGKGIKTKMQLPTDAICNEKKEYDWLIIKKSNIYCKM